jgi:hypothetical protein
LDELVGVEDDPPVVGVGLLVGELEEGGAFLGFVALPRVFGDVEVEGDAGLLAGGGEGGVLWWVVWGYSW